MCTKTELKLMLAEEVLPPDVDMAIVRTEQGDIKFSRSYDYQLAERILNFLELKGVKLYEE